MRWRSLCGADDDVGELAVFVLMVDLLLWFAFAVGSFSEVLIAARIEAIPCPPSCPPSLITTLLDRL